MKTESKPGNNRLKKPKKEEYVESLKKVNEQIEKLVQQRFMLMGAIQHIEQEEKDNG